jgi:hypothetical protein
MRVKTNAQETHMKRKLLIIMLISACLLTTAAFACADNEKSGSLRIGYYDPQDAGAGFTFGFSFGTSIDEAVAIGFATDVYYKRYVQESEVATDTYESGIDTTTVVREVEYNTVGVPLMLELQVNISILGPLYILGHGAVGYEILWNRENNIEADLTNSLWFHGFAWNVGVGPAIQLGSDTLLFVEGFYHGAKVRRNRKDIFEDLPVFEEVNLGGLGIRAGIAIITF